MELGESINLGSHLGASSETAMLQVLAPHPRLRSALRTLGVTTALPFRLLRREEAKGFGVLRVLRLSSSEPRNPLSLKRDGPRAAWRQDHRCRPI